MIRVGFFLVLFINFFFLLFRHKISEFRVWRPRVSERNVQLEKSFETNTDDVSLTAGLVAMVQMTAVISSGLLDHRTQYFAKMSRLIFIIIIRESFVIYASK